MKLFTLIHICESEKSLHNSRVKSFREQINLYLGCAQQLQKSLKQIKYQLIVITNDKALLTKIAFKDYDLDIIELKFTLPVPSGINFYSAHFKIEVYQYLSSLSDNYVGLIDNDVICINNVPKTLKQIISLNIPLYYDITTQVFPAYGEKVIIQDKEKLSKNKSIGLWAGGEFIAGPPSFFRDLYKEINYFIDDYFNNYHLFHHQGDEVLTSIAIENLLIKRGKIIQDAGSLNLITRYWNAYTLHTQLPLRGLSNFFFLHLPSDKKYLYKYKGLPNKFFSNYSKHRTLSKLLLPIKYYGKYLINMVKRN